MVEPRLFAVPAAASRREFLRLAGGGAGMLGLAALLSDERLLNAAASDPTNLAPSAPLAPKPSHSAAKAKSVIWLFMNGGQSQVDTWDYKPELAKRDGQDLPGFDKNTGFFTEQVGPVMKSPFAFQQHGGSGAWVSEIFPELARHVDQMAFLHACYTETNNHSPALFQINTGMSRMGFPCLGAWVTYGLGSESRNLPGFVVMYDTLGRGLPKGNSLNWGAGFLPGVYQGTALNAQGPPMNNLTRPAEMSDARQRAQLDFLGGLNRRHLRDTSGDAELAARIESFELAYRMQMEAAGLADFSRETAETQQLYGLDNGASKSFGGKCLMARRLVERGVRFVQVYSDGEWDAHADLAGNHTGHCAATDVPIHGLLTDLKRRGLFDSTLVIWGGEFGRMPVSQGNNGRDHNPRGFLQWMAGAGIKGGASHGETDEIGYRAAVDPVTVHDLHATMLHLLGMDHKRLTYLHNGRRYRLTDVAGNLLTKILA
jgi:hypothetical protein